MYVVAGASGNTGRAAMQYLLEHDKRVRALTRSADKLEETLRWKADAYELDLANSRQLARALHRAEGAYLMIPPNPTAEKWIDWMDAVSDSMAEAIEKSDIKYVVFLSSIGAQLEKGTGPIKGLHRAEKKFSKIPGVNFLFLRATFFMENLMMGIDGLRQHGTLGLMFKPEDRVPMIATRDIGHYAAERLMKKNFKGVEVQELLGQRDLTMTEVTKAIGDAIGRDDITYTQMSADQLQDILVQGGATEDVGREYAEMVRGYDAGDLTPEETRVPTNSTNTPIEAFAQHYAKAYKELEDGGS